MTSFAPRPRWEVDNNPNLTYPIVTRRGIREMDINQIRAYAGRIATVDERVADLEDTVRRQQAMIDDLALALQYYIMNRASNPNA